MFETLTRVTNGTGGRCVSLFDMCYNLCMAHIIVVGSSIRMLMLILNIHLFSLAELHKIFGQSEIRHFYCKLLQSQCRFVVRNTALSGLAKENLVVKNSFQSDGVVFCQLWNSLA
ncbi:hypothetical protein BT63DRAFT_279797 [Microthyrium microscopicum]|uniref:Uncharacterized protein n=1 Tax=Microthyrium microscopicum TaxID=703497 RepID=A0A6A6U9A4_9PEZI|nr:hypothetical protein BT63DRAFT_279797 [Microthyrium microscopicum]